MAENTSTLRNNGRGRSERLAIPVRRLAVIYLPLLTLATLLGLMASGWPFFPGDLAVARTVQAVDWPLFGLLLIGVSALGDAPLSLIVPAFVAGLLVARRLRLEAALLLVALASSPVHFALKALVGRARPTADLLDVRYVIMEPSFPSGHVVFFVTFYGLLCYLVWALWRPSPARTATLGLMGALIVLVGLSRVFLGVHFPSDVAGGYLIGGLWLAAIVEVHRLRGSRSAAVEDRQQRWISPRTVVDSVRNRFV